MSKETRQARCRALYDQFLALNPRELETMPIAVADFDGLNIEEGRKTLSFVLDTLDALTASETWSMLSWHAYNSIEGLLQALHNTYAQLRSSRDQNSWQNFAPQLDSMAYHLRMFGVPFLSAGGLQLERTSAALKVELDRLTAARTEVEQLRDEVKTLIAPAVAGSLSQAFTARKNVLMWGRIVWGFIALAVGGYCIHATYSFATAVGEAVISAKQPSTGSELVWISVFIRSVVLLPLYAAFGFSFAQYKKERDFEEEYAHKAAVATSLPNYGDLTREPAVRDQIVTGATNVIFSTPTSKPPDSLRSEKLLGGMKEIFDSVSKLVPHKE